MPSCLEKWWNDFNAGNGQGEAVMWGGKDDLMKKMYTEQLLHGMKMAFKMGFQSGMAWMTFQGTDHLSSGMNATQLMEQVETDAEIAATMFVNSTRSVTENPAVADEMKVKLVDLLTQLAQGKPIEEEKKDGTDEPD